MINKMDIFGLRNGATKKVATIPCDNSFHNTSMMAKDELSVSVVTDKPLNIVVGDYITIGGISYRMNRDAEFTQKSEVQHEYLIIFEHPIYTLLDKVLCNRITGSTKVVLTGKLRDFLELLVWNVNRSESNPLGVDTGWEIGLCPDTEYKNIVLDGISCRAALDEFRKAFNVEYYASNKTINFVSHIENETGLTFTQGRGKGLYSLEQKNVDSSDVVTRLFPKGGTENVIPGEGDEEGRLVLPEKYIEDFSETSKVVERVVKFEGIHPTFQGKVGALSGDNNKSFICNEIDFDIKELSVGSDARVNFLTGDLMGKAFEFSWDNSKKKITLIGQVDELALIDPNTQSRPVIPDANKYLHGGELFTLTGLRMSGTYKENAINTLREKGREWLKYHCRKRVKYNLDVDYRMLRGKRTLSVGDLVTVKDKNRGINALIRIVSVERNLRTGKLSCVVSNYLDEKWEKKIEGQIASVQTAISGGGHYSGNVDIIESNDARELTDRRVFSSLRAIREIEKKSLSKEKSDRTEHSLNVGEDLTVDGNATVNHDLNVGRNATVAKDLTVMEILRALLKIETASLSVSGNSKTGTLDVAGKATARDVEVANQVTSLNAVIRALATIHNLTVDNTADIMHGIIRQYLSSDKFVSGFLGEGFKVWQDAAGLWHGELDMLTVRKVFTVFELVVQKVVHQGGMVIRSAAGGKITKVTDGGSYWRCEHDSSDNFVKDDQVLCQVFTGLKMKRYWRLVTSAGAGYFNLSKTDCEAGSATPEVGDDVAVLGNRTNAARQSAQIDCTVGANAPYRDDYAGINSYSLTGKLVTRTGNLSGIVDPDFGALSGYGLYSLNAYLKGMLRLTSGKTVETAIGEARSGAISAAASDAQAKANAAKAAAISAAASDAQAKATLAETNAKTHAQAIFDGLRIGGRNLLLNSAQAQTRNFSSNGDNYSYYADKTCLLEANVQYIVSGVCPEGLQWSAKHAGSDVNRALLWLANVDKSYHKIISSSTTGTTGIPFTVPTTQLYILRTNVYKAGSYTFSRLKIEKGTKATDWTPALEDVEAGIAFEITKVRTDFDVREGQISSKVAEVTAKTQQAVSAAETAKANADASAAKLVAVTQKESNINQTAADIDLKAKRVEQAAGKAEAAEARVNVAADGVVVSAAKQAAQLAVDGVQVGGRNLLRNAINFRASGWNNGFSRYRSGSWAIDNTVKYNGKPTLKTLVGHGLSHPWLTLENGVEYTYSAMVRTEVDVTGTDYYPLHYLTGLNNQSQHKTSVVSHDTSTVAGQWKLIRIVFKLTGDADSFRPFFYRGATGGVNYWIAWLKLEKGNKATDGSPAPEDMEADAQAKADAAKQAAISDAAAKYPTKTEYSAQLAVLNNSISSKVSQTDFSALGTRMSAAEQKITPGAINMVVKEQITTAVDGLRIGGRNLYRKSAPIVSLANNPLIRKEADGDSVHGFWLTRQKGLKCSARIKDVIPGNGEYVISFWGKSNGRPAPKFDICDNPCTGDSQFTQSWKRFELRATVTNYSADEYNYIDIEDFGWIHLYIKDFKVEKGTKATDWSPAPEDVQADIALRPTKEEIKAGISMTSGGINVFGKEISLAGKVTFASLDASTQATINGEATTASLTALQNRLGAMAYQNMVSLAKLDNTIVQGGYIKTSLIEARSITADKIAAGAITADKLDVGSVQAAIVTADAVNALNITAKKIQSAQGTFDRIEGASGQDSMLLTSSLIRFKNSHTNVFIGADTMPASAGGMMVTPVRIHVERAMPSYHMGANAGLYLSVAGAKSYDDFVGSGNHALFIPKGGICGMRLRARRIGANTTLSVMDSIVFVIKTGVTVTLPDSGVEDGQIYFIRNHCGGTCRIAGNNIRAWNDGGVGNSFEVNRSNMAILMYDAHNNSWTANWTGNW